MEKQYHKNHSSYLNREMEMNVYGWSGKPVIAFPSENGHYYDWENFGMKEAVEDFIESGQIQLFCLDSIDRETITCKSGDPHDRVQLYEAWYQYVTEEVLPKVRTINGSDQKILVTGCSAGAYHAANFFFRRPDKFDSLIAMSGYYDTENIYGGYMDDLVYRNDPCVSIAGMPAEHPYMELFNNSKIIICVGQGPWESQLLEETRRLQGVLQSKGIEAWVDYWGYDADHDWTWWKKQFRYFLPHVLH